MKETQKKYLFVTESNGIGFVPKDFQNMRTEYAGMKAFNAYHIPFNELQKKGNQIINDFDGVFLILPKDETKLLTIFNYNLFDLNDNSIKFAFIQEGPHWYGTNYTIETQLKYFRFISNCDLLLVHNSTDVDYYKGVYGDDKPTHVLQSLMYDDSLLIDRLTSVKQSNKVIIGGNFVRWYGGMESGIVAKNFDCNIYAPSMGRKQVGEESIVFHLPYMNGTDGIYTLAEFKYAVHMMPTSAAGTFALNCSYLGIPCLGNIKTDTVSILHPKLAVDVSDINKANKLAKKLKNDKDFYNECSKETKLLFDKYYHQTIFKEKIINRLFENNEWRNLNV